MTGQAAPSMCRVGGAPKEKWFNMTANRSNKECVAKGGKTC
jgi:hypothetical protein